MAAAPAEAKEPTVETTQAPAAAGVATTREVPTSCEKKDDCYPPPAFVEAVCKKKFPDLPIYLFAGKLPWKHLWVKAEWVEPVNPHGGEQSGAWMKFGEEVLVLRRRAPKTGKGVQISGPSDVDVLRWDGTCATIREEMLVAYVPAPMQSPRIIFKYLNGELQDALLKNAVVARAREAEKKGCRDSSLSHPTEACEKSMRQLTDAIALAVRQNIELPGTGKVPEWVK
ncbi:MAG TPA: hypothetical protein VJN18_12055 [Polyangiaceae bacterium]|nr:hypothetical protein [Polyangiaceae bacterium]